ncbi:MAG TPA: hypothetical protein VFM98_18685 [Ramlibacter sp.]|uniref:hypothetical protein n=1 Tax=Ramlibacter sp. TaxID=1917967 RepID=UPI002D7F96F6|nr:hypothetical protein [Ramlibacter sp.]HET8747632.1 hypothetical protein [Ramlibacter sp.]
MCYLVRQQHPELEAGGVAQPPGPSSARPRWAGATAFAVFGGLALAGTLLTTPSMAPQLDGAKQSGAPLPVAQRSTQLPAGGGVQETALGVDDGVPTSTTDTPKGIAGNCHHGL